ncbi:MAG: Lacal_2735 family protein [Alteromonadaceae bacterium]|nr:Lacal_2735 family protein [Alteromonadaceae bacterium]
MFGLFKKDPTKALRKKYDIKLEQAMLAQRKGDIKSYSMLTAEAEAIWAEIQSLESAKA